MYLCAYQLNSEHIPFFQKHLFSKSWTAWVLGVELAKEGGGIDWEVFLRLTRDDLSAQLILIVDDILDKNLPEASHAV